MKQYHYPKDSRRYTKGANFDVDKEFLNLNEGVYIDARNMRNLSMDGTNGAMKKIGGMESIYPNIDNNCIDGTGLQFSLGYSCIGARVVNGNIIEFWAHITEDPVTRPSYIRINGQVVLKSEDFPITYSHPLQLDINESCIGGEIYITDFNVEPMIFNIEDLMANSGMLPNTDCTDKYFGEFNLSLYTLSLDRALNHPVFVKLSADLAGYTDILFGNGLPVGYVAYSFRYATDAGDRSSWSAPTNLIPVPSRLTNGNEPCYPHLQTHSKPADIEVPSIYGAHIKIRIDNVSEYDFIELRRDYWYSENPIGNPPVSEIIAKIDVDVNELSVRDIFDQGKEAEEIVSGDELIEVIASIRRAKAIRYFNSTLYLMNVEYESRDIADGLIYSGNDNTRMSETIENMGIRGHGEPHNAAKYKSLMRGERYGWGVVLWDGQGGYSFVDKVDGFENHIMPNRRDDSSGITIDTSYLGVPRAANVDGFVSPTYEVFDTVGATGRDNVCDYVNIFSNVFGDPVGGLVTKPTSSSLLSEGIDFFSPPCPTADDEGLENVLGLVEAEDVGYRPYYPTGQNDTNIGNLDYRVNWKVENDLSGGGGDYEYNPQTFSPRYFSLGMALQGVSGFPDWAKAFSVVRTIRADKVVAQGLGFYKIVKGEGGVGANVSKDPFEFWFYAPDVDDNHGINPEVIDAIQSDPSAYGVQLVSPLGFATEVYSFDDEAGRDKVVDFISWCRFYNDGAGSNARINPEENPDMGILDGTTGERHVSYGKWRSTAQFSPQHPAGDNGNFIYDIEDIDLVNNGRAQYYRLRTVQQIYTEEFTGGEHRGDTEGVQNWHEPVYMVNIIRRNAVVPDNNTTQYTYTGNYVKLESLIGASGFSDSENFELVDERWEDCIQRINGNVTNSTFYDWYRFCWVEDDNGNKNRWVNINHFTPAQITAALNDLQTFGVHTVTDPSGSYDVYGVYTSTETLDNAYKKFTLNFNYFNLGFDKEYQVPPLGNRVFVRYDNRFPVRVFGGDTFIGDTTACLLDHQIDKSGNPIDTANEFRINVAFPYRRYWMNPRIFQIKRSNDSGGFLGAIQQQDKMKFCNVGGDEAAFIRQMAVNFIAETRVCLNYAFNNEDPKHSSEQWFPLKHYIMRPHKWDDSEFGSGTTAEIYEDNNIIDTYEVDYGDEYLLWQYGGFRFINLASSVPLINLDYSQRDNTRNFTSTPKLGFEEQTYYCSRIAWSVRRPINIQDSATVRTFPSSNVYDISDDTGEIKFAWDAVSGKGNNLYAFTESGVCMLLVDKRIIHEIDGQELATVGSDVGGILNSLWISRGTGMSGETWRSAAEDEDTLYFVNHESAYLFSNNQLADIGRVGYHSKLYRYFLEDMPQNYDEKLTAVYDDYHREYWVNFGVARTPAGVINSKTLVFGSQQEMWIGGFDYDFDQYVTIDNLTYGIKYEGTFLLDSGNQIDGQDIVSELVDATVGDVAYEDRVPVNHTQNDKEFSRIRVNSNFKPTSIRFYNEFDQYENAQLQAEIDNVANPLAMKDYYGFEGYIPRKLDPPNRRVQGRLLIYNIINIFDEGFKITTSDIQYKKLK